MVKDVNALVVSWIALPSFASMQCFRINITKVQWCSSICGVTSYGSVLLIPANTLVRGPSQAQLVQETSSPGSIENMISD